MHLQYLNKVTQTVPLILTEEVFRTLIDSAWVRNNVHKARAFLEAGNKEGYQKFKQGLPCVMWVGTTPANRPEETPPNLPEGEEFSMGQEVSPSGRFRGGILSRKAADLVPTQLYMIDIDHMNVEPRDAWERIDEKVKAESEKYDYKIRIVHITPSGKGLRIVAEATQPFESVKEHMDWLVEELGLQRYGDYDSQCKDLSRLSFLVPREDFLLIDKSVFGERTFKPIRIANTHAPRLTPQGGERIAGNGIIPPDLGKGCTKDGEGVDYSLSEYRGHKLVDIAKKYVEVFGEPEEGERHAFYNRMAKDFRLICNNNWKQLVAILPDHNKPYEERVAQCKYFCKESHQSRMSKEFFFFLLNNGFYPKKVEDGATEQEERVLLESEQVVEEIKPPKLPPVFKEFCSICPQDFILPTINALMPIMGTLTSFLRADYIDSREQSTTFFSCIYAPPGSGKSFVTRFTEPLFKYLHGRDEISNLREMLFLDKKSAKSANDKDPEDPHVSIRLMPAINSQPEFLSKMRDNRGYHMFTYAEEVDTFNKGSKAGGGDKSDLFRVAWDNAEYGQAFKSAATFKGMVKLYYNILLTGTPHQVQRYYKNVEDGMVTRVSFCEIKNQEFGKFQSWKKLKQKQQDVIEAFIKRCDERTYKEPLEISLEEAQDMSDKEFEASTAWRFNYREFQRVNMEWLFPALKKWLEDERLMSSLQMDYARDTFRRRTAVKGFRLALVCMALWKQITPREQKTIQEFVLWWMDYDLQASLDLFGQKYNKMINDNNASMAKARTQSSLYDALPAVFEKSDVVTQALKLGISSPARVIVCRWMAEKLIVKMEKNKWKKKK